MQRLRFVTHFNKPMIDWLIDDRWSIDWLITLTPFHPIYKNNANYILGLLFSSAAVSGLFSTVCSSLPAVLYGRNGDKQSRHLHWTVLRTAGQHLHIHKSGLRHASERIDLAVLQLQRRSLGAGRPHLWRQCRAVLLLQQHFRLQCSAGRQRLDFFGREHNRLRSNFIVHL